MPARPWPIKAPVSTPIKFGADELARMIADMISEGALSAADFVVAQSGAGSPFVAMGAGEGYVRQDTPEGGMKRIRLAATLNSGTGYGAPNTGGAVVWARTFATPHATLARTDRVVATVRDANYVGGADYDWVFDVVPGTAGGSAAAVPANSILLANVLIRAASTTIITSDIDNAVKQLALLGQGRLGKRDAGETMSAVSASSVTPSATIGVVVTIATLPSVTFDGATTAWVDLSIAAQTGNFDNATFDLYDNGVALGGFGYSANVATFQGTDYTRALVTPTAGAHVYSWRHTGNGNAPATLTAPIYASVRRYA